MKFLTKFVAALVCAATANAGTVAGKIESLDRRASELTVTSNGALMTLRVRPGVAIELNGKPASFTQLALGMAVVVSSNEPGLATRISASGHPPLVVPQTGGGKSTDPAPTHAEQPGQPAPNAPQEKTAAPSNERAPIVLNSPSAVVSVIPADLSLKANGEWNATAISEASKVIVSQTQGKPATFQFNVDTVTRIKSRGWASRINAVDTEVSISGVSVVCKVRAFLRADQLEALGSVSKGDAIILSGTIGTADLRVFGGVPALDLDLVGAEFPKN